MVTIQQAVQIIQTGGLVAFPTETVYGLGADALNPDAVSRIFQVKGRPRSNPMICHVADASSAFQFGKATPVALKLAEAFWPGPLTILLEHEGRIPSIVTAGSHLAGFRVPDHPVARELLRLSKTPIAAPSANTSNKRSSTNARMVEQQLGDKIDAVLDGGPCEIGIESTVVKVTGDCVTILRQGGITEEMLIAHGFPIQQRTEDSNRDSTENRQGQKKNSPATQESPGQLSVHYTPGVPLVLMREPGFVTSGPDTRVVDSVDGMHVWEGRSVRVVQLLPSPNTPAIPDVPVYYLSRDGSSETMARNLFSSFDELSLEADLILIALPDPVGLGKAICDRMIRASTHFGSLRGKKIILRSRLQNKQITRPE